MEMLQTLAGFFGAVVLFFSSLFGTSFATVTTGVDSSASQDELASVATSSTVQKVYSDAELQKLAGDVLASGTVPLGDSKYVTSGPKKGYVYLCNARKDNPGSMVNGPWITGTTWNFKEKVKVDGAVSWSNASFNQALTSAYRTLTGNDLPINHSTGVFPVSRTDDAHQYDANPNTISAQNISVQIPKNPTYSKTPYCMGGEVGVMLSGVALFNGFDAGLRDAPAHELQDSCDGHPQGTGEYHYHSLSSCFKDTSVKTVIGFAYDGFPITGPVVSKGKYLTTQNLDECHGLTSEVIIDGKKTATYHYVMTYDFPYSASCFRGKPVTTGPSSVGVQKNSAQGSGGQGGQGAPPQEAISACSGRSSGTVCSFTGGRGESVSGICKNPQGTTLACVPQ